MKKLVSFVVAVAAVMAGLMAMGGTAGATDATAPGVKGDGKATIVAPLNPQQKLVAFACTSVATVAAASTSVDKCYLYADGVFVAEAESLSLSGQAATTASTAAVPSLSATLQVCWWVSSDPVLGPRVEAYGCTTVNTLVLAA